MRREENLGGYENKIQEAMREKKCQNSGHLSFCQQLQAVHTLAQTKKPSRTLNVSHVHFSEGYGL